MAWDSPTPSMSTMSDTLLPMLIAPVSPHVSAPTYSPSELSRDDESLLPVEHDLPRRAARRELESLGVVVGFHPVRDHVAHVEAALEHGQHLVPGLEHLAPVD